MAIKKVSKAKNLSAGPSKPTKKAGPVDAGGKWTKVQERTLGNMKEGGKVKKAQNGKITPFQDYVKKYPGSASDTLTSRNFDPRYNATDAGYFGSKAKQNKDLKDAYSKTYVKKEMSGVSQKDQKKYRVQKTGGKTTASMMKTGGKMSKKK